jgi:hypothetical protein
MDLFPSSGEGGVTHFVGSVKKSQPQLLDNLCQYNNSYINTWDQALSMTPIYKA